MGEKTIELLGDTNAKYTSLDNPFMSDKVQRINVSMWRSRVDGEIMIDGKVEFKHNSTSGSHSFKGSSIPDVLRQIESFLKSL